MKQGEALNFTGYVYCRQVKEHVIHAGKRALVCILFSVLLINVQKMIVNFMINEYS